MTNTGKAMYPELTPDLTGGHTVDKTGNAVTQAVSADDITAEDAGTLRYLLEEKRGDGCRANKADTR